ncbi:MAG: phenylalanine--tRNA ligase subunit alpha [Candidatus Saccharibacteria bacterium]|nr:phenylalanine--tRNA ligase subunit alpha [Candidatus Saccharibacteria bacterium]
MNTDEIIKQIQATRQELIDKITQSEEPETVLRGQQMKRLYSLIRQAQADDRARIGQQINQLRADLEELVTQKTAAQEAACVEPLDITAPWAENESEPQLLATENGSSHPLVDEIEVVNAIWRSMGFEAIESRQIDNDFNMFEALNFPEGHPARDSYDTFRTEEGLIPPAHTSTMQNRILKSGLAALERGENIAVVSYGRVFRNEDSDATHEHTFHQYEGMFVSKDATLAQMMATLKEFFEAYYQAQLKVRTQPGYFPFVEPGLEFMIEKPASIGGKAGDWLEMLGCGMIHPEVLKKAGIDPKRYRGFAWGGGFERLVMLKYGIRDIRLFESAKLDFLREF